MYIFSINIFGFQLSPSYYWLMYGISFLIWYYVIKKRNFLTTKLLDDLVLYIFLWVILWWRIWYILFYNFFYYIKNPLDIFKVWEWWMSFHWWVLWVLIAMIIFSKKKKINFYSLADQITLIMPIGLWLGRIWNYLNKELLWFHPYNWPLAININWVWYFPSTIIEWLLEWIILFIILNLIYKYKKLKQWQIASLFLIFYSLFRIFVEIFFRMPDSNIWYIFWFLTMWEILSLPMLIIWIYFYNKLKESLKKSTKEKNNLFC